MSLRRLVAFLLFLIAPALFADAPGVYAITGGTVHPVSGAPIPNGIVVIRDGLIEAVGGNVAIPADATTIDVKGAHVYPGLIDAHTSVGFAGPVKRSRGTSGGSAPREETKTAEPTPDFLAIRNVKVSDDDAAARRKVGITTVVTAPASGIFNGQSAVLNLGSGSIESRVIKSPAALHIAFNPRPTWTYPDSLMGVISYIRQTFFDAQQHSAARSIYERNPAGQKRPEENPALDALQPVLGRELPVVFVAETDQMMRRVAAIAREFNLRYIIAGARQAYAMGAELKNIPVLVSIKWPVAPADKEDREEQPLRVIRDRQLSPTTPAALAKSGVQFALVTGAAKADEFLPGIRKAIENGLSADDALRAATLTPARIFDVDRQLGSLERGKIANVVVSDKPIFDKEAKVTQVFVDGREIRLEKEEEKEEGEAEAGASAIDGTWAITVRAPQGNVPINVTLHAEDGALTGTYSGDRGSGDIRDGKFDGTAFDFTITASMQEGETSDWAFHGTITDSTMQGTVATTIGSFDFSGSKAK